MMNLYKLMKFNFIVMQMNYDSKKVIGTKILVFTLYKFFIQIK